MKISSYATAAVVACSLAAFGAGAQTGGSMSGPANNTGSMHQSQTSQGCPKASNNMSGHMSGGAMSGGMTADNHMSGGNMASNDHMSGDSMSGGNHMASNDHMSGDSMSGGNHMASNNATGCQPKPN